VPTLSGNVDVAFDASGRQMIRAPKFTLSQSISYTRELRAGTFRVLGAYYHSSGFPYTYDGRVRQKRYDTIDARVSWSPADTGLTISVYGRNLTNTHRVAAAFISTLADQISDAPP